MKWKKGFQSVQQRRKKIVVHKLAESNPLKEFASLQLDKELELKQLHSSDKYINAIFSHNQMITFQIKDEFTAQIRFKLFEIQQTTKLFYMFIDYFFVNSLTLKEKTKKTENDCIFI